MFFRNIYLSQRKTLCATFIFCRKCLFAPMCNQISSKLEWPNFYIKSKYNARYIRSFMPGGHKCYQKVNGSIRFKIGQPGAVQHFSHYKQVKYFKARNLCVRNFCNFKNSRNLRNFFSQTYKNQNFRENLFLQDEFSTLL